MAQTARGLFARFKREVNRNKKLITLKTTSKHVSDSIAELIFLRVFLTWEGYCEEMFLFFLLGGKTSKNKTIKRYVIPKDRKHGYALTKGLKDYPDWTNVGNISQISSLYFNKGGPFSKLTRMTSAFEELKTLRNAIAHKSKGSDEKFKSLVRKKIGFFPAGCAVGSFLLTKSKNGTSYLGQYCDTLETAANLILS